LGLTATGLLHTSFLPDLMQVNLFDLKVCVCPSLLHDLPATGAAALLGGTNRKPALKTKIAR
jgi:hypothetical protein